jgi:hypothetical protein
MSPPIINGAMYFKKLPSMAKLQETIMKTFSKYTRLTSIPVEGPEGMQWQPVFVNTASKFIQHSVNSSAQVHAKVEDIMTQEIVDVDRQPRWEFHLIDNSNGDSLVLMRMDHSCGDGISIVQVFNHILTNADGSAIVAPPFERKETAFSKLSLVDKIRECIACAGSVLSLPVSAYDSDCLFNDPNRKKADFAYSGARAVWKAPSFSLANIKRIKDAAGVTVNDVCFTACAGAIRKYCIRENDPAFAPSSSKQGGKGINNITPEKVCRALLPVAFPRQKGDSTDADEAMRNLFIFVSAKLPMSDLPVEKRLLEAHKDLNRLKDSPLAFITLQIQNFASWLLPAVMVRKTALDLFTRHSVVFSNVPGPANAAYLAGEEITEISMYYPNVITQVGIISYNGKIFCNFTGDPTVITNGNLLANLVVEEMKLMASAYKVTWDN